MCIRRFSVPVCPFENGWRGKEIETVYEKDGTDMATLLETWRSLAYGDGLDDKKKEELWTNYFTIEKGIYEKILSNPTEVVEGTVKELAEKYGTESSRYDWFP